MSILEDILAALKENTATLKALSGKTATSAEKPASKATADKGDEKPAAPRGRPAKPKALSATEMGDKAREFCEAAQDDEDEFRARRKLVGKLADKFGAEKFSAIKDVEDQNAALAALKEYLESEGDGDGDGDEAY